MTVTRLQHGAVIAAALVVVYANSMGGSFHYDDLHSIVENPHIRSLSRIPSFFASPQSFSVDADKAMFRPLLLVTYAANYSLGAYAVLGYHLVNLGLHLICALLVWSLARFFGLAPLGALGAALLFGLHPLCAEPVNYISSRSESLAACLYLAAFRLYLERRPGTDAASLACFCGGLLAKSTVITLPAVLWLGDYWTRGEFPKVRRHLWFWVVGAGYVALLMWQRLAQGSLQLAPRSLDVQIWTQLKAAAYYVKLVSMPVGLNVEHQFFEASVGDWATVLGAAILISLLALFWTVPSRNRLWLAWPVIVSLPTTIVPLNVLVNEHRLYLPLAGLSILAARWFASMQVRRLILPGAAALLACSVLTVQRNAVWATELELWRDSTRKSPSMPRPHVHLGNALQQRGQVTEAMLAFGTALRLDPGHRAARTNLANLLYEAGIAADPDAATPEAVAYLQRAAAEYETVLELDPEYREALNNLGNVYRVTGQLDLAADLYRRATRFHPGFGDGFYNLGRVLMSQGRHREAAAQLEEAARLQPGVAQGHFELGNARALAGDLDAALRAYRRARDLSPENLAHQYNLAETATHLGQGAWNRGEAGPATAAWQEALAAYERVALHDPSYRRVRQRLEQVRFRLDRVRGGAR